MKKLLTFTALSVLPLAVFGQAMINNVSGYTEDFNLGVVSGVKRAAGTPSVNSAISIAEPTSWSMSGENNRYSLSSLYAASSGQVSQALPFTADANNDASTDDRFDLFNTAYMIDSTVLPDLGANNQAFMKSTNTWADTALTLRFVNNTGSTINGLNVSLDTWWAGANTAITSFNLLVGTSYSSNGSGMTLVDSTSSPRVTTGWQAMETLGATSIALTVADGESIYVMLQYDQTSGGDGIAWDNLSVAPVPEPPELVKAAADAE